MPETHTATRPSQKHRLVSTRAHGVVALGSVLMLLAGCQSTSPKPVTASNRSSPMLAPVNVTTFTSKTAPTATQWNARMRPLFNRAKTLVEQHTNISLADVTLNIASDQVITAEVSHETQRLIQSQFNDHQFAKRFLDSVMNGQHGTYAALYATRTNEVMVSSPLMQSYQRSLPTDKNIQESALLALLIHELVHAADDKRYKIHENRELNFRASFAQSAAFEGHAQWLTRRICAEANCLSGLEALDDFMFGRRNPPNKLTQPVQAISRNVLEYSYVEGERFVANIANRDNGQQLIAQLLSKPPQDPIQILDPKSYPNTQREQRNQQLIAASTGFTHPWLDGSWTTVQTSPLKGVNLRTDPSRRNAAVDGFTRLITSMVALQLYDQSQPALNPIELTVLQTESGKTAELFAQTLHENTRTNSAQLSQANALLQLASPLNAKPAQLYMTKEPSMEGQSYYTLVGVSGTYVVQIAGVGISEHLFVNFIDQLLQNLNSNAEPLARAQ